MLLILKKASQYYDFLLFFFVGCFIFAILYFLI